MEFISDFKSRQIKLSRRVLVEIEEILAEAFALLSAKVRDHLKHLERSNRGWDALDIRGKAKALVDIEKMLAEDREIIKKNRVEFVLSAFNSISNTLMGMSFDEIQEDLLHLASDNNHSIMIRITALFPTIDSKAKLEDSTKLRKAIEGGSISKFFNENGHGKDKEILSELIVILALGSKEDMYSEINFYTCDEKFIALYGEYRENESSNNNGDNDRSLVVKSLSSLSLVQAY
ncbi:hypothetical protein IX51_01565 [uncultured archaeon]|nr:hypothetical protein IX51_01565 [uncultured archaeon]